MSSCCTYSCLYRTAYYVRLKDLCRVSVTYTSCRRLRLFPYVDHGPGNLSPFLLKTLNPRKSISVCLEMVTPDTRLLNCLSDDTTTSSSKTFNSRTLTVILMYSYTLSGSYNSRRSYLTFKRQCC